MIKLIIFNKAFSITRTRIIASRFARSHYLVFSLRTFLHRAIVHSRISRSHLAHSSILILCVVTFSHRAISHSCVRHSHFSQEARMRNHVVRQCDSTRGKNAWSETARTRGVRMRANVRNRDARMREARCKYARLCNARLREHTKRECEIARSEIAWCVKVRLLYRVMRDGSMQEHENTWNENARTWKCEIARWENARSCDARIWESKWPQWVCIPKTSWNSLHTIKRPRIYSASTVLVTSRWCPCMVQKASKVE